MNQSEPVLYPRSMTWKTLLISFVIRCLPKCIVLDQPAQFFVRDKYADLGHHRYRNLLEYFLVVLRQITCEPEELTFWNIIKGNTGKLTITAETASFIYESFIQN